MAAILVKLETERLHLQRGRTDFPTDEELSINHQRYVIEFDEPGLTFQQYKDVILFDYYSTLEGNRFGYYTIFPKGGEYWLGHCYFAPRLCTPKERMRFGSLPTNSIPYHVFELEIGWALGISYRNRGYATEAAQALVDHAFQELQIPRIVAFTEQSNQPSVNVMRRLHMQISLDPDTGTVIGWIENHIL
ncbi:MAG: GNAT family N-acetyltransferase [Caldilineaceae bacterium]